MNQSFRRFLLCSILGISTFVSGSCFTSSSRAEDTARQLAARVSRMNDWLMPSEHASQWRTFLDLNTLDTLVGQGYQADTTQLAAIHQKFMEGAAARHRNFAAVAGAIESHLQQIQQAAAAYPSDKFNTEDLSAWQQAFEGAKEDLSPMSAGQLNRARGQALHEVMALQQFLQERGPLSAEQLAHPLDFLATEETETSASTVDLQPLIEWLSYDITLDWESSEAAAELDQPSIVEILRGIRAERDLLARYAKKDPNPYVSTALLELNRYDLQLFLGSRENLPTLLGRQVDRLVESMDAWTVDGDRLRQNEIVRIVGLLEATDQVPALTAAFKRTFWYNNAAFEVSESLVNRFASRPVTNTRPVDEYIWDNHVLGTAHTNGQVQIDMVPNDQQAHFSLHLQGVINADNYSPVGPITVYTGSQANIEARRSIYLNSGGWVEKAPYGSANLGSYFRGTSCGRLIEQIAQKQFETQRDGAQRIAARRAQERMLNEFGQETTDALVNGRSQLQEQQSKSGTFKAYRPTAYLKTTEDALHGFASRYGHSQMAALRPAPALQVATDVKLQVHDSLLNNYLEDELGGVTFTDQDLDRIDARAKQEAQQAVTGTISDAQDADVTDQPAAEGARDPFELTLESSRPIDLQFDDQTIKVTINIQRFRSQGQSITDVQVKTQFKMHYEAKDGVPGIRIEQLGNIEAALADPDDISIDSATILNLIETTINEELERQRTDQSEQGIWLPINLIDRTKIPALQELEGGEQLDLAQLVNADFTDGWASFAWKFGEGETTGAFLPAIATAEEFEAMQKAATADKTEARQSRPEGVTASLKG